MSFPESWKGMKVFNSDKIETEEQASFAIRELIELMNLDNINEGGSKFNSFLMSFMNEHRNDRQLIDFFTADKKLLTYTGGDIFYKIFDYSRYIGKMVVGIPYFNISDNSKDMFQRFGMQTRTQRYFDLKQEEIEKIIEILTNSGERYSSHYDYSGNVFHVHKYANEKALTDDVLRTCVEDMRIASHIERNSSVTIQRITEMLGIINIDEKAKRIKAAATVLIGTGLFELLNKSNKEEYILQMSDIYYYDKGSETEKELYMMVYTNPSYIFMEQVRTDLNYSDRVENKLFWPRTSIIGEIVKRKRLIGEKGSEVLWKLNPIGPQIPEGEELFESRPASESEVFLSESLGGGLDYRLLYEVVESNIKLKTYTTNEALEQRFKDIWYFASDKTDYAYHANSSARHNAVVRQAYNKKAKDFEDRVGERIGAGTKDHLLLQRLFVSQFGININGTVNFSNDENKFKRRGLNNNSLDKMLSLIINTLFDDNEITWGDWEEMRDIQTSVYVLGAIYEESIQIIRKLFPKIRILGIGDEAFFPHARMKLGQLTDQSVMANLIVSDVNQPDFEEMLTRMKIRKEDLTTELLAEVHTRYITELIEFVDFVFKSSDKGKIKLNHPNYSTIYNITETLGKYVRSRNLKYDASFENPYGQNGYTSEVFFSYEIGRYGDNDGPLELNTGEGPLYLYYTSLKFNNLSNNPRAEWNVWPETYNTITSRPVTSTGLKIIREINVPELLNYSSLDLVINPQQFFKVNINVEDGMKLLNVMSNFCENAKTAIAVEGSNRLNFIGKLDEKRLAMRSGTFSLYEHDAGYTNFIPGGMGFKSKLVMNRYSIMEMERMFVIAFYIGITYEIGALLPREARVVDIGGLRMNGLYVTGRRGGKLIIYEKAPIFKAWGDRNVTVINEIFDSNHVIDFHILMDIFTIMYPVKGAGTIDNQMAILADRNKTLNQNTVEHWSYYFTFYDDKFYTVFDEEEDVPGMNVDFRDKTMTFGMYERVGALNRDAIKLLFPGKEVEFRPMKMEHLCEVFSKGYTNPPGSRMLLAIYMSAVTIARVRPIREADFAT
jgi:hypothetical protein